MVDDDDPKLPFEPAPDAPADDKEPTPTEQPEGDKPEGEQAEAKAPDDELDIADTEDEPEEDEDEGEGDERKRTSRAERYRRQAERLKAENESLRSRSGGSLPPDQVLLQRAFEQRVYEEIGDPPRPEDFKDDYVALSIARQAWENDRRQVTREVRKEFQQKIQQAQRDTADLVTAHKERAQRFKSKVKDYDEVMAKSTLPVMPHVERLLLHSKKSERLGYVLAKNEAKLAQLNRMSPEDAAREIGRLEGRLSLPQSAKTQTQARKPITPLRGSGASPPSGLSAVNNYMKKLYGDRMR